MSGLAYGQVPDTAFRATVVITEYASSPVQGADWRITMRANDLRLEPNLADLKAGNILFDNACMALRVIQVSVPGSGPSATVRVEVADVGNTNNFPAFGDGAIVSVGPNGLIGTVQNAPERVNTCITWYNTMQDLGGGRVDTVSTLGDTATVFQPPRAGDVAIKSDTAFIAHYTGSRWIVTYLNTASGGGGPVSWNDLTNVPAGFADGVDNGITEIITDASLVGTGLSSSPLRLNLTYLDDQFDNRIEVEETLVQTTNATTIPLTFTPDSRYPIMLYVNGQRWTEDADFSRLGSTLNLTNIVYTDWRWTVVYTKQQ